MNSILSWNAEIIKNSINPVFQELNHVLYFDNLPDNKCKFIWIMKCSNGDCDVSKIVINYIYRLFKHRKQSLHNINFTKPDS